MDSQAAVSFLTLARYEQRVKLGMKMVVVGLHDSAPTQPRALHSEEGLLPGCIWLRHMLPGSETPLCRASRPGPLSLLNPASAPICCPSSPKHPTWLDTGTLPSPLFLLRSTLLPPLQNSLPQRLTFSIWSAYPRFTVTAHDPSVRFPC